MIFREENHLLNEKYIYHIHKIHANADKGNELRHVTEVQKYPPFTEKKIKITNLHKIYILLSFILCKTPKTFQKIFCDKVTTHRSKM